MAVGKGSILRAAKAGGKKENGVEFMTQAKETVMEGTIMAEEKSEAAEAMPQKAEVPQTDPGSEGTVKKTVKKRTSKAASEKASTTKTTAEKTQKKAAAAEVKKSATTESRKEPMRKGTDSAHVGIKDQMPAYLL